MSVGIHLIAVKLLPMLYHGGLILRMVLHRVESDKFADQGYLTTACNSHPSIYSHTPGLI